jgi:hypothetical protein
MSQATTAAPSAAKSSALARPIPLAAPVTTARFPERRFMGAKDGTKPAGMPERKGKT